MHSGFERYDELRNLARQLWDIVSQSEPRELETLGRLRREMAGLVREWIVAEDLLLDSILRKAPALPVQIVRQREADIQRSRAAYSQHVRDWPMSMVERDWAGYREAVRVRLADLADYPSLEESDLYREALKLMRAA